MTATIRIIESSGGEAQEAVLELGDETVTIGRAVENHVRVTDPRASKIHCQIERSADGYKLVDLESQDGITVNGLRVNFRMLEDGDRIAVGDVIIVFETPAPSARPRIRPLRRMRHSKSYKARNRRIKAKGAQGAEAAALLEERLVALLEEIAQQMGPDGVAEAEAIFQDYVDRGDGGRFRRSMEEAERLRKLVDVAKAVNSERNLRKLLNIIIDEAVTMTGSERGFLVLKGAGDLKFEAARNFDRESVRKPEYKISRSVAESVLATGTAVLSADAQEDARFAEYGSVSDLRLRSLICVPTKLKAEVTGVIYLDNRFETGVFSRDDLKALEAFADLAAIAMENARLHEENQKRAEELSASREKFRKLSEMLAKKLDLQGAEAERMRQSVESEAGCPNLKHDYSNIVGASPAMVEMFHLLDRVIESDAPVLIQGESGTGKELVAQAIHRNGRRADTPFVSENCAAIPETLLESELFGYRKGAFTGAFADKKGLFETADGGTLFLDEIAEMSVGMQKKLLRALQEGEIRPVGAKEVIRVNVRLIAASNKDLKKLVEAGQFRDDLYYRINVLQVVVPPLRDRRADILLLGEHFASAAAKEAGVRPRTIGKEAMSVLQNWDWPGNVRELENEVRRACTVGDEVIIPDDLSPHVRAAFSRREPGQPPPLKEIVRDALDRVEREAILAALSACGWRKSDAARQLCISRPTLDAKIAGLKIEVRTQR